MNLPNALSLLRGLGSFVFLWFGLAGQWRVAFPIFCVAALTDMVDGAIARLTGQRTRLGAFLDPMADKLLMFFSFLTLTLHGFLPLGVTLLVVARDLLITVGLIVLKSRKVPITYHPTVLSKATTLFQIVAVLDALLMTQKYEVAPHLVFGVLLVTSLLTVTTGIQYFRIGQKLLKGEGG